MSIVLTVPVIADIVGSFLSTDDLMSCRRVSKAWYESYSTPYRKTAVLVIENLNDFKKLVLHPDERYASSPHKRVCFELCNMEGVKVARSLEKFWNVHQTGLTSVSIFCVENFGWDILLDVLYRKTPNLKSLRISNSFDSTCLNQLRYNILGSGIVTQPNSLTLLELLYPFDQFVDNKAREEFLRWILTIHPNIMALKLEGYFQFEFRKEHSERSTYPYLENALARLVNIRRGNPKAFQLQTLNMSAMCLADEPCITASFLKTLEDIQFPLRILTIDLGTITNIDVVIGILQQHKSTLQDLIAFGDLVTNESFGGFPFGVELDKLISLRISASLLTSIQFLTFTQNLEVLNIYGQRTKRNFMHEVRVFSIGGYPFMRRSDGRRAKLREFLIDYEEHNEIIDNIGLRNLVNKYEKHIFHI